MDSEITRTTAAQTSDETVPPLMAGFWPSASLWPVTEPLLTAVTDLSNAAELSRGQVKDILRRRIGASANSFLGNACYEVGRWLADHGTTADGFKISVGVNGSRVLIEFTDHGARIPDMYRSREDAALAFGVLTNYVIAWGSSVIDGVRTLRIYADADSPATPGDGGYFE